MALPHDMVGLYFAVGNANHLPPWGGTEMLLSTNPVAVAVPAGEEPPVVLDMATTVAAYGKVKTKAQRGESMPEGWMVGRDGKPLTDPRKAHEGFLLPLGGLEAGYKGFGLALVIGLLAGTLNGAALGRETVDFNADDRTPTNTGQAILALDIAAFGDAGEFKRRVDALARELRASPRMPGFDRIWLPGEQSRLKFLERSRSGVPVPEALGRALDELAARLEIDPLRG
jgi:L-2-hydroxycarboxylate dehydrogenase (NAD+)